MIYTQTKQSLLNNRILLFNPIPLKCVSICHFPFPFIWGMVFALNLRMSRGIGLRIPNFHLNLWTQVIKIISRFQRLHPTKTTITAETCLRSSTLQNWHVTNVTIGTQMSSAPFAAQLVIKIASKLISVNRMSWVSRKSLIEHYISPLESNLS